jgi:hypothetical protein
MYNPQLALALARAAAQAYTDGATDRIADFAEGDARAIILRQGKRLIVAFRGTRPEDLSDWLTDFDAKLAPWMIFGVHCCAHAGFIDSMDMVRMQVDAWLLGGMHDGDELYVTGHSKGAAEACLYASTRNDVTALYTYGQPRTGDADFAAAVNGSMPNYYRAVNDADIVPRVPSNSLGFAHAGHLIMLLDGGKISEAQAMPGESLMLSTDVGDHSIDRYILKLGAACP